MLPNHNLSNDEIIDLLNRQDELEFQLEEDEARINELQKELEFLRDKVAGDKKVLAIISSVKYTCEEDDCPIGPIVAISSLGLNPDKYETLRATDSSVTRYGCIFKSSDTDQWSGKLGDTSNKLFEFKFPDSSPSRDHIEVAVLDWIIAGTLPESAENTGS